MKLGVLFSGGKDSCYAMFKAMHDNEIIVLISVISENEESYMFHVPNISLTKLQAEATRLPLIQKTTKGVKEEELEDLKQAIIEAKKEYGIEGIVTGAVQSVYQASRIQKICDDLGLECINPLWQIDQEQLLRELVENDFKVMIVGIAGEGLDETWLGREIDNDCIQDLKKLNKKYGISLNGEGGEYESLTLSTPFFKKNIKIIKAEKKMESDCCGQYIIEYAVLI